MTILSGESVPGGRNSIAVEDIDCHSRGPDGCGKTLFRTAGKRSHAEMARGFQEQWGSAVWDGGCAG